MTLIRRPGVALVTLLFLLLGAAFIAQVVPYQQIIDSQRQVTAAQERLATLEADNAALQADAAALNTDEEIEKLAREKLGMSALVRRHMSFSIARLERGSGHEKKCWWWTTEPGWIGSGNSSPAAI